VFSLLGISLNPLTWAKDFVQALIHGVLVLFGTGAAKLVAALLGFVETSSNPVFSSGWWSSTGIAVFERVLAVSGSLLALAFMCSVVSAVLSGDHTLLSKAALRLPLAVIEMALLVAVTAALVSASDEIAAEIAKGASHALSVFVATELASAIAGTGIVGLIAGLLVILAALGIWAELLIRSALIYLAVLCGPLIFAASVHPSVRGLRRRYFEGGLALIASKIVVALALTTGAAMLSGLSSSTSFAQATGALLEALAVLAVACFAPFVLLRLIIGAEVIVAAEGLERRPARAALSAASTASRVGGLASMSHRLAPPSSAGGAPPAPGPTPTPSKPTPPRSSGPSASASASSTPPAAANSAGAPRRPSAPPGPTGPAARSAQDER
jgi:type IV secretion system protein TrbL